MLPFLTDSDSGYLNRAIYALPPPLVWKHTPRVTPLRDTAHLMSPFGGFGVNLAMLDGAELARAIAEEPTIDAAIWAVGSVTGINGIMTTVIGSGAAQLVVLRAGRVGAGHHGPAGAIPVQDVGLRAGEGVRLDEPDRPDIVRGNGRHRP